MKTSKCEQCNNPTKELYEVPLSTGCVYYCVKCAPPKYTGLRGVIKETVNIGSRKTGAVF